MAIKIVEFWKTWTWSFLAKITESIKSTNGDSWLGGEIVRLQTAFDLISVEIRKVSDSRELLIEQSVCKWEIEKEQNK